MQYPPNVQATYSFVEEEPSFYFTVAQQPDIANTAFLDGNTVSRNFTFRSINNSVITRPLNGAVSNNIEKPMNLGCSASTDMIVILSGKY